MAYVEQFDIHSPMVCEGGRNSDKRKRGEGMGSLRRPLGWEVSKRVAKPEGEGPRGDLGAGTET